MKQNKMQRQTMITEYGHELLTCIIAFSCVTHSDPTTRIESKRKEGRKLVFQHFQTR